jgi:hypothetical protein
MQTVPLTELEIAARVYSHPLIQAYDRALTKLRNRHEAAYGADYCAEPILDAEGFILSHPGVHRWTAHEEEVYSKLYAAFLEMRADVRSKLTK